jgi:hypothetical protein
VNSGGPPLARATLDTHRRQLVPGDEVDRDALGQYAAENGDVTAEQFAQIGRHLFEPLLMSEGQQLIRERTRAMSGLQNRKWSRTAFSEMGVQICW